MINDADAAGLAEMGFCAGASQSGVAVMVSLGTGISNSANRAAEYCAFTDPMSDEMCQSRREGPKVTVEDVRTEDGHELYLVRPDATADGAAVLYLHWFDEAPSANRTQYLEEATRLAEVGVVSLLPQLSFPWHSAPTDTDRDLGRIKSELEFLHAAHAVLSDTEGVDNNRIAVVGHDFGAM
ncbi:MAG TPA: hypothetical protein VMP13_08350 [Acidimicrobiia bacterium]|nr:hypothetical protein [Acidimicrobiia bacterium]